MTDIFPQKPKGRGALSNPVGRFEKIQPKLEPTDEVADEFADVNPQIETQLFKDKTKSSVTFNDSPDIGFSASLNPYRGCEHGCIYCYARPGHEYFGLSAGIDFETKIFVKENAAELLREKLMSKSWQPQTIVMSGVTDCYQPAEKKLKITRHCLEVCAEFRNPVAIITKNHLVTRDADVLGELAKYDCASVHVSITTLDPELCRIMEPRTSQPRLRLEAVRKLRAAGVPVSVGMSPIIPGLTDHEIPTLLKAAAEAGAMRASYTMLRLPYGVKDLFENWLEEHYPLRKKKILNRLRSMRNGKLYDAEWGTRMKGEGFYADQVKLMFEKARAANNLYQDMPGMSVAHFKRPSSQLDLF